MMHSDSIVAKGLFQLRVFNINGELLEDYNDSNLVVSAGKDLVARLLAGDVATNVSKIAVGTNGIDPSPADTAITGTFVKNITSYSFPQSNAVLFSWEINDSEANNIVIREFGLLFSDNTLFARKTRSEIVKTNAVRLVGTWKIVII